jgi:hypothetical protein
LLFYIFPSSSLPFCLSSFFPFLFLSFFPFPLLSLLFLPFALPLFIFLSCLYTFVHLLLSASLLTFIPVHLSIINYAIHHSFIL